MVIDNSEETLAETSVKLSFLILSVSFIHYEKRSQSVGDFSETQKLTEQIKSLAVISF